MSSGVGKTIQIGDKKVNKFSRVASIGAVMLFGVLSVIGIAQPASADSSIPVDKCKVTAYWTAPGTAHYVVPSGCTQVLSFVAYNAPSNVFDRTTADKQTVFSQYTVTQGPGTYNWHQELPKCFYQLDFVYGQVLSKLGPANSNNFYGQRLILSDNGGAVPCVTVSKPTTTVPKPVVTTVLKSTVEKIYTNTAPPVTTRVAVPRIVTTTTVPMQNIAQEIPQQTLAKTGFDYLKASIFGGALLLVGVIMFGIPKFRKSRSLR